MTRLRITTPSRLHFGLLGWGDDAPRQFGGVGLMIDAPGLDLSVAPATDWSAAGPLADRAARVAQHVAARLASEGMPVPSAHITIHQAPPEHVGLGVGTQLSLAVALGLIALAERGVGPSVARLAALSGRGLRSGIGLHGFTRGGLIVDGGRRTEEGIPPMLVHHPWPLDWAVLLVIPRQAPGLHGSDELRAFAQLPPIPPTMTDRLCRLVLLGLLPALVERDIRTFGAALTELQQHVGRCFAPAQGGTIVRPELAEIIGHLRAGGLHGVGQSSWGPTLYAFSDEPAERRAALLERLRDRIGRDRAEVFWTAASRQGHRIGREP